jgi:type I restriction enzyme R subunit
MESVLSHTDKDIPTELINKDVARAFYGICLENLGKNVQDETVRRQIAIQSALAIDDIIQKAVLDIEAPIIDWQDKANITGKIHIDIGDYFIDEVRDKYGLKLTFDDIDNLTDKCIEIARIRYK